MTDGTIDHIGIATTSLDESQQLWTILGFAQGDDQINSEHGVKIRFMHGNTSTRIELLEPLGDDTPVGKFISKNGPGVQQIACLLYTSPSPRDRQKSRMPSSA